MGPERSANVQARKVWASTASVWQVSAHTPHELQQLQPRLLCQLRQQPHWLLASSRKLLHPGGHFASCSLHQSQVGLQQQSPERSVSSNTVDTQTFQ